MGLGLNRQLEQVIYVVFAPFGDPRQAYEHSTFLIRHLPLVIHIN